MESNERQRYASLTSASVVCGGNVCLTLCRPSLPPIKLLDIEKVKREEAEYQTRNTSAMPAMSSVVATSPSSFQYPSGPPPPYSHPAPPVHASMPSALSDARTPPEGRRMSAEEQSKQQSKQSLPSIHEALGVEQPMPYASQQPFTSAPQSTYQAAAAPASPSTVPRRAFGMEPPPPPVAAYQSTPRSPYSQYRRESSPRQAQEGAERRSIYSAQPPPTVHQPLQAAQSPVQHSTRYPHPYAAADPSPTHERAPALAGSMAPPSLPYGYAPYPPQFATYPPTTGASSASVYQPSVTQPPPGHQEPSWKTERHLSGSAHESGRNMYGESVKRHLDLFDFEAALNEVCLEFLVVQKT